MHVAVISNPSTYLPQNGGDEHSCHYYLCFAYLLGLKKQTKRLSVNRTHSTSKLKVGICFHVFTYNIQTKWEIQGRIPRVELVSSRNIFSTSYYRGFMYVIVLALALRFSNFKLLRSGIHLWIQIVILFWTHHIPYKQTSLIIPDFFFGLSKREATFDHSCQLFLKE